MFRQPDNVIGVAPSNLGYQLGGQFIQLLFEEPVIAIGRVYISAAHQVAQPEHQE